MMYYNNIIQILWWLQAATIGFQSFAEKNIQMNSSREVNLTKIYIHSRSYGVLLEFFSDTKLTFSTSFP